MIIKQNKTSRTNVVIDKYGEFSVSASTSFKKAKRGTKVFIESKNSKVKLTGRQAKTLFKVLHTAFKLSGK